MKLATFTFNTFTRVGVVIEDRIIDLASAAPGLPREMVALLALGEVAIGIENSVIVEA